MENLLKLGLDWQSIVFYIVNFGVLFLVIAKYLMPVIFKFLDERRDKIQGSINEANRLQNEFEGKLKALADEKQTALSELNMRIEALNKEIISKKAELIAEMDLARQNMMASAQKEIDERKALLIGEVEDQVKDLMKKVVLYVLQNQVPEEAVSSSIQDAWKKYQQ
jgi:F-type H+-transporting ATPase subunit b